MSYDTLPDVPKSALQASTSHPEYNQKTTGTVVATSFSGNIKGKTVCITGVSPKSLGETLAKTIAKHSPATLILASRTKSKLEEVARLVKEQSPGVDPHLVVLDLGSQEAIRTVAAEILSLVSRIDILINNAAVVSSSRQETVDGLEQTFGTNHVGHFLFTSLLTPLLVSGSGAARVVNVTSLGYRLSPVRFHDYNFEGKQVPREEEPPFKLPQHMKISQDLHYAAFPAYGQSKTSKILHCVSLNEKFGSKGLKAVAVHPGSIWTDLSRNLTPQDLKIIEGTAVEWVTTDQGISTILVAALDPQISNPGGVDNVFMSDCQFSRTEKFASDSSIAERLWHLSEKLTGGSSKL